MAYPRCALAAPRCTLAAPSLHPQAPHGDFELPPAEAREGQASGTSSGPVFGAAFGAASGTATTGTAADSYGATLGRLCTRGAGYKRRAFGTLRTG